MIYCIWSAMSGSPDSEIVVTRGVFSSCAEVVGGVSHQYRTSLVPVSRKSRQSRASLAPGSRQFPASIAPVSHQSRASPAPVPRQSHAQRVQWLHLRMRTLASVLQPSGSLGSNPTSVRKNRNNSWFLNYRDGRLNENN